MSLCCSSLVHFCFVDGETVASFCETTFLAVSQSEPSPRSLTAVWVSSILLLWRECCWWWPMKEILWPREIKLWVSQWPCWQVRMMISLIIMNISPLQGFYSSLTIIDESEQKYFANNQKCFANNKNHSSNIVTSTIITFGTPSSRHLAQQTKINGNENKVSWFSTEHQLKVSQSSGRGEERGRRG